MSRLASDLIGQRFGRWTVIGTAPHDGNKKIQYLCRCDCGTVKPVRKQDLYRGKSLDCGCTRQEKTRKLKFKHGLHGHILYKTWKGMKNRCCNPHNSCFRRYGGRGIKVCERWLHSFEAFCNDLYPSYKPGTTLDRINNDGDYEPGNVRWATPVEQNNNTRRNVRLTWNGQTHTISEWAAVLKIPVPRIKSRIQRGWPIERILTEPVHPR
jgi:hypothetical protein